MRCSAIELTDHALLRMGERDITVGDVRFVLQQGYIIEDYPDDPRGHSCLVLGIVRGAPVHVCVGIEHAPEVCDVIAVYEPTLEEWETDFRTRRRSDT